MDPIEILIEEHRLIKRGLDVMAIATERIDDEPKNIAPHFLTMADFIRNFADACHHAKEEDVLFPELEKRGIPHEGGPIGVMLMEHDEGRKLVGNIKETAEIIVSGDDSKVSDLKENAMAFVGLLRHHIDIEDNVLYMIAREAIPPDKLAALEPVFKEREEARVGKGAHEKYTSVIENLESIFRE